MDKKKKIIIISSVIAAVVAVVLLVTLLCVFLKPEEEHTLKSGNYYLISSGDMTENAVLTIEGKNYTLTVKEGFEFPYFGSGTYHYDGKKDFTLYKNDKIYVKGMLSNGLLALVNDKGDIFSFKHSSIKPSEITPSTGETIGLKYRLDGGMYSIVGIDDVFTGTEIVIPQAKNGISVTKIAAEAFSENSKIKKVQLPKSITEIGERAFYGCVNLQEINIPDNLTALGKDAFENTKIAYEAIGGVNYLGKWAISLNNKNNDVTSVTLKDDTVGVCDGFLSGCDSLETLVLSPEVKYLGETALYGAKNLKTITSLGKTFAAFGNALYKVRRNASGVIEKKEKLIVVAAKAIGESFEIPSEVVECGYGCLYGARNLKSLTLPFIGKANGASGINGVIGYLFGTNDYATATGPEKETAKAVQNYSALGSEIFYIPKTLRSVLLNAASTVSYGALSGLSLTSVDFGKAVAVSDCALKGVTDLAALTIPNVNYLFGTMFSENEYDGGIKTEQYNGSKTVVYYIPSALKTVEIALRSDDETLSNYLFSGCRNIEKIYCTGGNVALDYYEVKNADGVLVDRRLMGVWGAFLGCDSLTELNLGNNYILEKGVLYAINKQSIKESLVCVLKSNTLSSGLTLTDGVKEICKFAFADVVLSLTLNADLEYFADDTFTTLTELNVNGNANFENSGGIIYTKKKDKILFLPSTLSGNIVLSSALTHIPNGIFDKCSGITSFSFDGENKNYFAYEGLIYNSTKSGLVLIPDAIAGEQKLLNSLTNADFSKINATSFKIVSESGIEEAGEYFSSENGIVYDGKKTKLLFVPKNITGEITLPNSVTTINEYAFYERSGLTAINIGKNVTEIGKYAFGKISAVVNFDNEIALTTIDRTIFNDYLGKTVTIPSNVKYIGKGAFKGAINLKKLTIPFVGASATESGKSALLGYVFGDEEYNGGTLVKQVYLSSLSAEVSYYVPSSLEEIVLTGDAISLKYGAFSNVVSLKKVSFGKGLIELTTVLARSVFYGTTVNEIVIDSTNEYFVSDNGLVYDKNKTGLIFCPFGFVGEVVLPNTLTSFKQLAIDKVTGLTALTIGSSDIYLSEGGVLIEKFSGAVVGKPDSVTYTTENGVEYIGNWAVKAIGELTAVTLKTGTVGICQGAFSGLKELTQIDLTGVKYVGSNAFMSCDKLSSITGIDGIISIGDYAFRSLESQVLQTNDLALGVNVVRVGKNVFGGRRMKISVSFKKGELPSGWDSLWVDTAGYTDSSGNLIPYIIVNYAA